MNGFNYREIKPAKNLKNYIDCYWHYNYLDSPELPNQDQVIEQALPPDPCPSLVFYYHQPSQTHKTFIGGPSERSFVPKTPINSSYTSIKFQPGVIDEVLGIHSKSITNQVIDVTEKVKFIDARSLCQELNLTESSITTLDQACSTLIKNTRPKLDPLLTHVVKLIHKHQARINVEELAQKLNISRRQLQRRLKALTGLNPSSMIRLIRIRACMKDIILHNKSVIETAYRYGYTDQPHLIKHLKRTTGINANSQLTYFNRVNPVID